MAHPSGFRRVGIDAAGIANKKDGLKSEAVSGACAPRQGHLNYPATEHPNQETFAQEQPRPRLRGIMRISSEHTYLPKEWT